ncbi:MAG: fibronectin type III domain-containing protein [Nitrospinae bacterium]|nr:fibronectin type III domain-containing protein [Nitrospinota bacterium]
MKRFDAMKIKALMMVLAIAALLCVNSSAEAPPDPLGPAETLYHKGKFSDSVAAAKEVLEKLEDGKAKAKAHVLIGVASHAQGLTDQGEEEFHQAVQLDPSLKLSTKKYPPTVIRLYNQARARYLGAVAVQTSPGDAEIYIDGKLVGLTPVVVEDLLVGKHKIRIVKSGQRTEEREIDVRESERSEFYLELSTRDEMPPVIESQRPDSWLEEKSLRIKATVTDNIGVGEVKLFFRVAGGTQYESVQMEQTQKNVFEGAVPAEKVTRDGVQYYISAYDNGGNEAHEGKPESPLEVRVMAVDKEPPRIFHTPVLASSDASKLFIRANVKDNKALSTVRLFYKRGADATFIQEPMKDTTGAGDYESLVPEVFMAARKISYYIEAADEAGNVQYSGRGDAPHTIAVYKVLPFIDGYIVERKKEGADSTRTVTVNVGTLKGFDKDRTFTVFSADERVTDPQSGMVLSINQKVTGKVKITIPGPASSQAKITTEAERNAVKPGDMIRFRPSAPAGVGGYSKKYREITVTWSMNPEPEVSGYVVYRSDKPEGPFEEFKKVYRRDNVEAQDRGGKTRLADGQKYYYRVVAVNEDNEKSEPSEIGFVTAKGGPNPPTQVSAAPGLVREIPLAWQKSDDEETVGYKIQRATEEAGKYEPIADLGNGVTSYSDKPRERGKHVLEDGKTYWYKIVSYNRDGKFGNATEAISAASRQKPKAPSGLTVTSAGVRSVSMSWDMHQDPDIAAYRVYRNTSGDGVFGMVKEVSGRAVTEYKDQDKSGEKIKDGVSYFYRLTAVNGGGAESDFTQAVNAITLGPPPAPAGVGAKSGLVKKALVTWTPLAESEVAGYTVWRGESPSAMNMIKKISDPKAASYMDAGDWLKRMKDGTSYYYAVRSFNTVGVESEAAVAVEAKTKPAPVRPSGLSATQGEPGRSTLKWSPNPEADIVSYKVLRSASATGSFGAIGSVKETYYEDTGLKNGMTYYYRVQATDKDELLSPESDTVSVATKPVPSAPGELSAVADTSAVTLTWKANPEPDIDHYEIYSAGFFGKQKLGDSPRPSFIADGLKPDTSYTFVVTAVDKAGLVSDPSAPAMVQTKK